MLGARRLVDRIDATLTAAGLHEALPVVPDRAALDLHHDDAHIGEQHDQVGFVVLVLVDDPDVREHQGITRQRIANRLPDVPLTGVGEPGLLGQHPRRHALSSRSVAKNARPPMRVAKSGTTRTSTSFISAIRCTSWLLTNGVAGRSAAATTAPSAT